MREHQIVINLKRDQFEEVRRLARLAGSKSVSAYLKERVLELLAPDAQQERPGGPTLEEMLNINHELSRMHRELQVFIAESLSNSIYSGDDELQSEFDPDDFDQTFAAFQEMERNMEEEIEKMNSETATRGGSTSRSLQSDTINHTPVDPRALHGPQAFKRADSHRAGNSHRNQSPGSRRSTTPASMEQNDILADQDYPITGFPLASDNVLDASAEIPGMEENEPIVLPPTPGANRARSNQRIRIIPTPPPPTAEEQAAHWKAQQMPSPAQSNTTSRDKQSGSEDNIDARPGKTNESAAPITTGVPDALPPSEWSGHPISNFVESAGIYTSSADSIWFTPPAQVLKPGLQPDDPSLLSAPASGQSASDPAPEVQPGNTIYDGAPEPASTTSATTKKTGESAEQTHSPFEQPNDELEDLAERAFAISPRLGTFDSSPNTPAGIRKRQAADPLDELIDGSIMEEAQRLRASNQITSSPYDDGVVYAFGGPDAPQDAVPDDSSQYPPADASAEERALLLGASTASEQLSSDPEVAQDTQIDANATASRYTQSISGSFSPSNSSDILNTQPDNDSQTADVPLSQQTESPRTSSAPSPDPGALGGPPPKRKRTSDTLAPGDDDEIISGGPPPKRRKK